MVGRLKIAAPIDALKEIGGPMNTGAAGESLGHLALVLLLVVVVGLAVFAFWRLYRVTRIPVRTQSYRAIAEAAGDAIFEFDILSRSIHWTNDESLRLLGFEPDAQLQLGTDYGIVHPDDRDALRAAWDGLAQGRKIDLQLRVGEPGSSWSWFHITAAPVQNQQGRAMQAIGVMRCTNDLHQMQETLAEARRLETVGTIAGGIAHEFNNHLTPVRGYIELALDELSPDEPSYEGLKTALDRVIHCSDLVAQIQAYGRKSLLVLRDVNLAELLPDAVRFEMSIDRANGHNVTLNEQWPENLPPVALDKVQFQQGLHHLIQNAHEAMPDGGTLSISARCCSVDEGDCYDSRDAKPGEYVVMEIRDDGVGIASEHVNQVLDPFFTTHGRARARGMGLPMVQGMMAQHDGWMQIDTVPGEGTVVGLYFPVATVEEPAATAAAPEDDTVHVLTAVESGRILVADDERFIRTIVRKIFESEDWTVDEAEDYQEVMDQYLEPNPVRYGAVLLDLTMRGPSTEDTIEKILSLHPDTRILIMSGFDRNDRVNRLAQNPNVGFISKPFSTKALLQRVDELNAEPVA